MGAVPLTNENVKKVIAIVEASSFEHKTDMLTILKRWENDNFSTVAEDHNFFGDFKVEMLVKPTAH